MKKIIFLAILLAFMAMPASAAIQKATLINVEGKKVVVEVGSYEAQLMFRAGYVLMTDKLGAISGPDVYQRMNFISGFNRGGSSYATTSTAATYTLTKNELGGEIYYLSWTPNVNTTLTLPATTTALMKDIVSTRIGDTREYYLYNASSTVASTITLAAGTGVDLQKNEDTANLATAGTSVTKMTFIRKVDSDVMVILDQYDVAD